MLPNPMDDVGRDTGVQDAIGLIGHHVQPSARHIGKKCN
jgi:hypothetical protein